MRWGREDCDHVISVLRSARTLDEACTHLGVTRSQVKHAFQRHGLPAPSSYLRSQEPPWRMPEPVPREPEPAPIPQVPPPVPQVMPVPKPRHVPLPNNRARTYLVASDIHVPYEDSRCVAAVGEFLRDLKPDGIVIAGDFLDLLELSRHSAGSLAHLEGKRVSHTFQQANALLDNWQAAAGEQCVDCHFIDGNHEDRIGRWLAAGDHGVWAGDVGVDLGARLRLKERGWTHHAGYPNAGVDLGKLHVTHGRWTSKYHAARHLDGYRHSVMYGHTHTPQVHYASALHGQQVAIGLGHLADPDSEAMAYAGRPNNWVQGFAVVTVRDDGSFNALPVTFWDRRFSFGGKTYG